MSFAASRPFLSPTTCTPPPDRFKCGRDLFTPRVAPMYRFTFLPAALALALLPAAARAADPPADGKLRIIVFGAHPDDAEFKAGGTAIKWAKAGHHVKLVSVTNG